MPLCALAPKDHIAWRLCLCVLNLISHHSSTAIDYIPPPRATHIHTRENTSLLPNAQFPDHQWRTEVLLFSHALTIVEIALSSTWNAILYTVVSIAVSQKCPAFPSVYANKWCLLLPYIASSSSSKTLVLWNEREQSYSCICKQVSSFSRQLNNFWWLYTVLTGISKHPICVEPSKISHFASVVSCRYTYIHKEHLYITAYYIHVHVHLLKACRFWINVCILKVFFTCKDKVWKYDFVNVPLEMKLQEAQGHWGCSQCWLWMGKCRLTCIQDTCTCLQTARWEILNNLNQPYHKPSDSDHRTSYLVVRNGEKYWEL